MGGPQLELVVARVPDERAAILLVEDDPLDAKLFKLNMPDGPARIWTATTIPQAIALLAHNTFSLAVVDLSLPGVAGLDGIIAIRHAAPDLALVVLTGAVTPDLSRQLLEAGAQDVIIKGDTGQHALTQRLVLTIERHKFELERSAFTAAQYAQTQAIDLDRARVAEMEITTLRSQLDGSAAQIDTHKTGLYLLALMGACAMAVAAVIVIYVVRPDKDNTALTTMLITMLVPVITALGAAAIRENVKVTNSRLTQLLRLTETAARRDGAQAERDRTAPPSDTERP